MGRAWLILSGTDASASGERRDLKPGLTILGGARGDIPVPASGGDCVHLWSDPPKLIFVGANVAPIVNGKSAQEIPLHSGDRIEWRGLVATFGCEDQHAHLEELSDAWHSPEPALHPRESVVEPAGASPAAARWRWLKAGLAAEMALADPAVIRRWQEVATRGEFDADVASRELLAAAPDLDDFDPKLTERSARLMRDLLMSSLTKRPARQPREGARSGFLILLAQLVIFVLFALVVIAAMLVMRTRYSQSIDAHLDQLLKYF